MDIALTLATFVHDHITRVVLAQLEEFVENDYTVVLFSGGARYRPGWKWLFRAYRSLGRRYVRERERGQRQCIGIIADALSTMEKGQPSPTVDFQ